MTIVFDLDDTISVHKNRDYENAVPIDATVDKIRALKSDGWEIVIYTARGQHSCRGDLKLIEERNRAQIEKWLKSHAVPYDKLIFGKPLGDIYVDDKGISLGEFLHSSFRALKGNSGSTIYQAGKQVIKTCSNAAQQAEWYEKASKLGVHTPTVYSVVLDTVYMSLINGHNGSEQNVTAADIFKIVSTVMLFSLVNTSAVFDVYALKRRAEEHLKCCGREHLFKRLFSYLITNEQFYAESCSFCHGDLSLSNTIFNGSDIYFIDPIINDEYSSYLLDLAKLRFSLDGGETFLHKIERSYQDLLNEYDNLLSGRGLRRKVIALEAVYWIRLLKYTPNEARRTEIIRKAEELEQYL